MEDKTPNTGGRPPAINPTVLQKLIGAFQMGFSNDEACEIAGIAESTFYNYQKQQWFLEKINDAKNYGKLLAGETIADVLRDIRRVKYDDDGNKVWDKRRYSEKYRVETAWKYLEKKSKEFQQTTPLTPEGGKNGNTFNQYNFYTNKQIEELTKQSGVTEISPAELLEATPIEYVDRGPAEGSTAQVPPETLQPQNTQDTNVSEPSSSI